MSNDTLSFLKNFIRNPTNVGSLCPSSKWLAQAITNKTERRKKPLRYLEIGAGSGALTTTIIQNMKSGDTLDLVEIDPKFCQRLRDKYGAYPQVRIHELSILEFTGEAYDFVFSSLPLNAFSSHFVGQIFKKFEKLVKKGGFLSYYEYRGLGKIKRVSLFGKALLDFKQTLFLKNQFLQQYCIRVDKIFRNIPPAKIYHCQL